MYLLGASKSLFGLLEVIFLDEASPRNLGIATAEFRVTLVAWNETTIFGDNIGVFSVWSLSYLQQIS